MADMFEPFADFENFDKSSLLERSPNLIAYIGDAVIELYARTRLASGIANMATLHKNTTKIVSAKGQAKAYHALTGILTEKELAALKRGRNTASGMVPKNASVGEYRSATAVECLVGTLYLLGEQERLSEILNIIFTAASE